MKRKPGYLIAVLLGALAIVGVLFTSYGMYRAAYQKLNGELNDRIRLAATEATRAAVERITPYKRPSAWSDDDRAAVRRSLEAVRKASKLEHLFVFDLERRSLADARPRVKPGKRYTLFELSPKGLDAVREGRSYLDDRRTFESLSFRNVTWPLKYGGEVIGGVYAQASIDFDQSIRELRRSWIATTALSVFAAAVFVTGLLWGYRRMNRIEEAMQKRARLDLMSRMSAGIAHDIKNPLFAITGAAELLEGRHKEDAETRELLRFVREGADGILEIVTNLLGSGAGAKAQEIELHSFAASVVKQLRPAAMEKRVKLEVDIPVGPRVHAAPTPLRMALANIVHNGLEAVAEETGRIHIDLRQNGRRLGLAVSDNGPGIPASLRKKIFEPLVTTKQDGSGLGLPTARQTLEDMNGALAMETEVGKGTTFVLWLPGSWEDHGEPTDR